MSSPDEMLQLWGVADGLLGQCRSVMAETYEFWGEIEARFDDPILDGPEIQPAVKADFVVARVSMDTFLQRATDNVLTLEVLLQQGKSGSEAITNLNALLKATSRALVLNAAFAPAADFETLKTDLERLPHEAVVICVNASNAIIAVTTPWFFMRGAFAVYLNKPTLGANAFALAATLLKEGALHELAKQIPFIGTVVALAEMIKKQEERGYHDFVTFIKQSNAHVGLEKALDQGLHDLDTSDQVIAHYHQSIQATNAPFVERVRRVRAFAEREPPM